MLSLKVTYKGFQPRQEGAGSSLGFLSLIAASHASAKALLGGRWPTPTYGETRVAAFKAICSRKNRRAPLRLQSHVSDKISSTHLFPAAPLRLKLALKSFCGGEAGALPVSRWRTRRME